MDRRTSKSLRHEFAPPGLLPMPGLRHDMDPRFALITHQNERESVSIRLAKLIYARTSAGFGHWSCAAGFLNCDCITREGVVAPDFCLWRRSCYVKCAVRVDCPDGPEGVSPCACERARAGHGTRCTRSDERYQSACKNNSETVL